MLMERNYEQFGEVQIFNQWKAKWNSDAWQYFGKCPAKIPEEEIFLRLFEKVYRESTLKMAYNKKRICGQRSFLWDAWRDVPCSN